MEIPERGLLEGGIPSPEEISTMREAIGGEVNRIAEEADARPLPGAANPMANIFAAAPDCEQSADLETISTEPVAMIDAVDHVLREEMQRNPKIAMWGEDIADPKGGVFGVTRGLAGAFPSPLAEASIAGVAGGMAIAGYKPIVEMQFGDYLWPAAMQLRDEIPTVRWRSDGEWSCPVALRVAVGGYIKSGPCRGENTAERA